MSHYNLAWDATTYFYTLLFRKRKMPNGIYNEHHIILWHGMKKNNLTKRRLKCVLSDHYVFLLHLLHSTMHIYLQNRCTYFSKQRIQKKLYTLEKRKGQFHFRGQGYHVHFARQYILQLDQYVCNTIFLLNPTWIIIVHFVLWFISNMFLFFL